MSFDTLKVKDLKSLAANFAVDVDGLKNKADVIAALAEEGVTWSVYQGTLKNIENAKEDDLKNIQKNINFNKNHPSTEHFLPLFIAYGNAINKKGKSFNTEMLYSNISMESFIFDNKKDIKC